VPAGIIIALGLTWYTLVAHSMDVSVEQLRTGATIILAVVGIWVLTAVSRPLNRYKVLVIGGMFVALLAIFTIPAVRDFFELVDPGQELAVALTGIVAVMIAGIEVVRFFHQRLPASVLGPSTAAPSPSSPGNARAEAIVRRIVVVLIYVIGLVAAVLGILILLSRYEEEDSGEVVRVSLVGAGIALFGLLLIAAGGGVRRGSRLSRVLATLYLSALILLNVLDIAANDVWGWEAITTVVMSSVIVLALWTPPVARTFRRTPAPASSSAGL
jgi:cation-transporting ATPase E